MVCKVMYDWFGCCMVDLVCASFYPSFLIVFNYDAVHEKPHVLWMY